MILALMLASISAVVVGGFSLTDHSSDVTSGLISNQKSFYVADGIRNVAIGETQLYLSRVPAEEHSAQGLSDHLQASLGANLPPDYTLESVKVSDWLDEGYGPVASGPYHGMIGNRRRMMVTLEIQRGNTSGVDRTIASQSDRAIGTIELFLNAAELAVGQFIGFSDLPSYQYYSTHGGHDFFGIIQANGNLCVNSGGFHGRLISAKKIVFGSDRPECGFPQGSWGTIDFHLSSNLRRTIWQRDFNGCTDCASTRLAWRLFTIRRLGRMMLDQAHGVLPLKLGGSLESPATQKGLMGASGVSANHQFSNSTNMRYLVDPPRATDPTIVSREKLANQADIVIIGGVWYLKTGGLWPGIPIWSDHPGRKSDIYGNAVGQLDLKDYWQPFITAASPGAIWSPRRYSIYAYDHDNQRLFNDAAFYDAGAAPPGTTRME